MRSLTTIMLLSVLVSLARGGGQERVDSTKAWSTRIADSFLLRHPAFVTYDTGFTEQKWNYEQGVMLWALHQMSLHSGDPKYDRFVEKNLDQYVDGNGRILHGTLAFGPAVGIKIMTADFFHDLLDELRRARTAAAVHLFQ